MSLGPEDRTALLLRLAWSEAFDKGPLDAALYAICEAAAEALACERVSVWSLDDGHQTLTCEALFVRGASERSSGTVLSSSAYPRYFAALEADRIIAADDAHTHLATYEFSESYLTPLGISSMLDAIVHLHGTSKGVLCNEHVGAPRVWTSEEQALAAALADLVARAIEAEERRRAEAALQRANEELEARVAARTRELNSAIEALWGEMELARRIQSSLVPPKPSLMGFDVAGIMKPADEVGGDLYDVIDGGAERGHVVIGDVSGHGVPAGLVMMMCQTAIRSILGADGRAEPGQILRSLNRVIVENLQKLGERRHVTMTILRHDGGGRFVHAGLHLDLMIYRAASRSVEVTPTHGTWIGLMPDIPASPPEGEVHLAPGDALVLYTDGLLDAADEDGPFGQEGLRRALSSIGGRSAAAICDGIMARIAGSVKADDVTILVVKRV